MARWWRRSTSPDPLGTGVWRRGEERFRRAVDRYHQVLERVEATAAPVAPGASGPAPSSGTDHETAAPAGPQTLDLAALENTGAELAALLERVHEVCVAAQALAPSEGEDIPPGPGGVLLDVHRAVGRAATLVAQAAESVTLVLVTLRAERPDETEAAVRGAARATEQAGVHVARAGSLIASADVSDSP